jgi:hypothetical protein
MITGGALRHIRTDLWRGINRSGGKMILAEDYEDVLGNLALEFLINNVRYVPDLASWAKKNNLDLYGPHQLMKLISEEDDTVTMVMQSEIPEEMLDGVITSLGIRWSLKDNVFDPSKKLNSVKKRMAFAFLKEYARALKDVGGDEFLQDDWAIKAMDALGFFKE